MRYRFAAIGIACLVFAAHLTAQQRPHGLAEAEGCAISDVPFTNGNFNLGTLTAGDCTFPDGTRYDHWRFQGKIGDLVIITLTPTDASFTHPYLGLVPPPTDASATPAVFDVGPEIIHYVLSSTGQWHIFVGTGDLTAGGRYELRVLTAGNPYPNNPQNCVRQAVLCGQTWAWSITATSCLFSGPTHVYAPFTIDAKVGDLITIKHASDDFDPALAIYFANVGGSSLATAFGRRFSQPATLIYNVTKEDTYLITAYSPSTTSSGDFAVSFSCVSTCTPLRVFASPAATTISSGRTATLVADAVGTAPYTYRWYSSSDPSASLGTAKSFMTPVLYQNAAYGVHATDACSGAADATATITVACTESLQIVEQPHNSSVPYGTSAVVQADIRSSAAITYRWYEGVAPDTSKPLNGFGSSIVLPNVVRPITLWVRATTNCATADSASATITPVPVRRRASH